MDNSGRLAWMNNPNARGKIAFTDDGLVTSLDVRIPDNLKAALLDAFKEAVAAEREECAKVAESITRVSIDWPVAGLVEPHEPTCRGIATAIRSRNPSPDGR